MLMEQIKWITTIAAMLMFLSTVAAFAETEKSGMALQGGVETRALEVATDSAIVLESDEAFSELSIANPKIADISTLSSTTLYILGKQPGRTTLMLIRQDGTVMSVVDIRVAPDVTELERRLGEILPGEGIEVLTANDGLVLSGIVSSAEKVEQALTLAGHYAPGKISNLITVKSPKREGPDVASLQSQIAQVLEGEFIEVQTNGDGVVLSGNVSSNLVEKTALGLAEPYAPGAVTSNLVVKKEPAKIDTDDVQASLNQILPNESISVHELAGNIVLSGTVSSQDRLSQALQVARLAAGNTAISNLLTVEKQRSCRVRTRRGGELIEIDIPCRENAAKSELEAEQVPSAITNPAAAGDNVSEQIDLALVSDLAPRNSPFPRKRPAFD